MEFLNPGMVWGLLAISLPLVLHFWHQKRGKELPWAAYRWLAGTILQSSRGIRLENILLLILRCILLSLLVFYLSEPHLKRSNQEIVHWIQPRKEVVENFRFELEEAGRRGEKRFWFNGDPVTELNVIPEGGYADLQVVINKIKKGGKAEIYLSGTDDFTRFNRVYLPAEYTLHTPASAFRKEARDIAPQEAAFPEGQSTKVLKVLLESEKESISAALKAITEVYGLHFEINEQREPGRFYDVAFTHRPDSLAGVNFVSGAAALPVDQMSGLSSVIWFDEQLKPESSDRVFNGELPEIILEALKTERELPVSLLSKRQLRDKFGVRPADRSEGSFPGLILVFFILILGAERWLAIHKNA